MNICYVKYKYIIIPSPFPFPPTKIFPPPVGTSSPFSVITPHAIYIYIYIYIWVEEYELELSIKPHVRESSWLLRFMAIFVKNYCGTAISEIRCDMMIFAKELAICQYLLRKLQYKDIRRFWLEKETNRSSNIGRNSER